MTRVLLNRATGALLPYPRQDDEPVAGLDRGVYMVVEVIREPQPEHDPSAFSAQPLPPVVSITDPDGDDVNGSATYGWELVIIVPPTPVPDWPTFKGAAMPHPALNQAIAAAIPSAPAASLALPAALLRAEQGDPGDFRGCWRAVCAAASVAPEIVAEFVQLAEWCNLPAEFVAALQP